MLSYYAAYMCKKQSHVSNLDYFNQKYIIDTV